MKKSLLLIVDISGYTNFVKSSDINHSQHVISELLEILLTANTLDMVLAEIEGDALFFYLDRKLPTSQELLHQINIFFVEFYSHLALLNTNRICNCKACTMAIDLELKVVVHSANLSFINVRGKKNPFGPKVIEIHRLLKNSVQSDNYVLITNQLIQDISLNLKDQTLKINYDWTKGKDHYDGVDLDYYYSHIDAEDLQLNSYAIAERVNLNYKPQFQITKTFPIAAEKLIELITNYSYRPKWTVGIDEFIYKENEVTRVGTEHQCVINGKELNFKAITKDGNPGQYVYGEQSQSIPFLDTLNQFWIVSAIDDQNSLLELQFYWTPKFKFLKGVSDYLSTRIIVKNVKKSVTLLFDFVVNHFEDNPLSSSKSNTKSDDHKIQSDVSLV